MTHFLMHNIYLGLSTEVPGTPSAPEVSDIHGNSVNLSWQPPTQDGGTPLLGYHIERRSGSAAKWVFVSREPIIDTR